MVVISNRSSKAFTGKPDTRQDFIEFGILVNTCKQGAIHTCFVASRIDAPAGFATSNML